MSEKTMGSKRKSSQLIYPLLELCSLLVNGLSYVLVWRNNVHSMFPIKTLYVLMLTCVCIRHSKCHKIYRSVHGSTAHEEILRMRSKNVEAQQCYLRLWHNLFARVIIDS